MTSGNVRQLWPLLWVSDLEASVRFWSGALGFAVVGANGVEGWRDWCRLARGDASLMLQEGRTPGPGVGAALYFVCEDVDALRAELASRGVRLDDPVDAPYGMRQLRVPEPDGYEVWFETPLDGWSG